MVRATPSTTKPSAPVPTPVVAAVPEVKVKVPKTKTVKSVVVPDVVAPVSEEVVTTETVDVISDITDKSSLTSLLATEKADAQKNFQTISNALALLKVNMKNMDKLSSRLMKFAEKSSKRMKTVGKLSGFEKPTLISDDLAVFFGRDKGSRMARTEVSKHIHEYVTKNNLQNKDNRRIIKPDAKLQKLLAIDSSKDELTYFNLQKYLKLHFKKDVVVA